MPISAANSNKSTGDFQQRDLFHLEYVYGEKLKSGVATAETMNLHSRHMLRLQYGGEMTTEDDDRIKNPESWEVLRNYLRYRKSLDDHEEHIKYYKVNLSISMFIFNQT